jgi:hypothetical protein
MISKSCSIEKVVDRAELGETIKWLKSFDPAGSISFYNL